MKAKTFDEAFDNGDDISNVLDMTQAKRGDGAHQRIGVDLPLWMLEALDAEAGRLGVTASRSSRCGWRSGWKTRLKQRLTPVFLCAVT